MSGSMTADDTQTSKGTDDQGPGGGGRGEQPCANGTRVVCVLLCGNGTCVECVLWPVGTGTGGWFGDHLVRGQDT